MKKYLIIISCVYVGYAFASDERENLIPGVKVCEISLQAPDWVSRYQQDPQLFLSLMNECPHVSFDPCDTHELREILQKDNSVVNPRTFLRDYTQLLHGYREQVSEFEREYSNLPGEVVGHIATWLASIGGGVAGGLGARAIYNNCRENSTPQQQWDGTCEANLIGETLGLVFVGTLPVLFSGSLWLFHRHKKMLKERLLERQDERLIAAYTIIKKVFAPGRHKGIDW